MTAPLRTDEHGQWHNEHGLTVHRWMRETRMSCGHQLVQYADQPDGTGHQRCPLCGQTVVIQREEPR